MSLKDPLEQSLRPQIGNAVDERSIENTGDSAKTIGQPGQLFIYCVLRSVPGGSGNSDSPDDTTDNQLLTLEVSLSEEEVRRVPRWLDRLNAVGFSVNHGNSQTYRHIFPVIN